MSANALRVVVFGLPSAGKSALLGALAQAAQTQENLLGGRIVSSSERFTDLHKSYAENLLQPTREQVVEYSLSLERGDNEPALAAELVDSSGNAAAEMRQPYGWRAGALGKAVRTADALVVAAEAVVDGARLQQDLRQLAAFLRLFEQTRSRRTEVSGLPVYLVLTKCDLLARKDDSAAAWLGRVEERKRQVEAGFRKYLSHEADRERLAFGKLELQVLATAARLPPLADRSEPRQPFGVAELFRECLQAAARFQERRAHCADRLKMTVFGTAGLIGLMLVMALAVYLGRPSAEVAALESALQGYLPGPETAAADRLKEPLDKKLAQLRRIQKDAAFAQLPPGARDAVAHYVQEVQAYQKLNKEFLDRVRDPRLAGSEQDLAKIEKQLADISLPAAYAGAWKDTRLGRRPDQWRQDIKILRAAVTGIEAWIHQQIQSGRELEDAGLELRNAPTAAKKSWLARYRQYLEKHWPYPPRKRLPGTATLTYETVYHFDKVQRAQRTWDEFKQKNLAYVRQLLERVLP